MVDKGLLLLRAEKVDILLHVYSLLAEPNLFSQNPKEQSSICVSMYHSEMRTPEYLYEESPGSEKGEKRLGQTQSTEVSAE